VLKLDKDDLKRIFEMYTDEELAARYGAAGLRVFNNTLGLSLGFTQMREFLGIKAPLRG
jgi:hypothetical protein